MIQTTEPLTIRLARCLSAIAEELQSEIDARYNGTQDKYPDQMRRYQRDISTITKARELVAEEYNGRI